MILIGGGILTKPTRGVWGHAPPPPPLKVLMTHCAEADPGDFWDTIKPGTVFVLNHWELKNCLSV